MLFALFRLDDGSVNQFLDKREPHVGDGGRSVHSGFFLHLHDDMLQGLFLILVEIELLEDTWISFDEFRGGKTLRDPGSFCVVVHEDHDTVQASVDRASTVVLITEVQTPRTFLVFRNVKGVVYQLVDTFVLRCRDGDDRNTELVLHLVDEDGTAVASYFVHHVQRDDHRNIELHELHGQVEVTLDICCIDDVDDAARLFVKDELTGDDLLGSIR